MKKILIIRLSSLGDIIHNYPMLYDIKSKIKDSQVDWLVDANFADLIKLNNLVDGIIPIPLRIWKKNKLKFFYYFFKWYKYIKNKDRKYDYIIDSHGMLKSSILNIFFKGPKFGYDMKSIKEKISILFYNNRYRVDKNYLATTKNRILAQKIFNYDVDLKKVDFGIKNENFPKLYLTNQIKYIIFFSATSKDSKKYPISNWLKLAQYLIDKHNIKIVIPFGNKKELKEAQEISNNIYPKNNIMIPDKILTYFELHCLISNAEFVFGVDTGLVHLANALNKKLIAIFTDTNPNLTGIFESNIAKNIGNIGVIPSVEQIINLFENIIKI